MIAKIKHFFTFIRKEKLQSFFAFAYYVFVIAMFLEIDLPLPLDIINFIIQFIIGWYICDWLDKSFVITIEKLEKNIIKEIKKIANEILMFVPIFIISIFITSFIMVGEPANQTSIAESFFISPIFNSIMIIIIGPITEEIIFRFLPYKFIKNKTLYIIVSTVIFAAMHVVNDANPFYYIWFYMLRPLYYGYRYYETKDIWVPISLHSFNNLISILFLIL